LKEFQIGGVATDLEFLQQVIDSPQFLTGRFDTTYLDHFEPAGSEEYKDLGKEIAAATALYAQQQREMAVSLRKQEFDNWQLTAWREQMRGGE
jgi:acetyl/propionyl-CoA carboxylase alpha subunit